MASPAPRMTSWGPGGRVRHRRWRRYGGGSPRRRPVPSRSRSAGARVRARHRRVSTGRLHARSVAAGAWRSGPRIGRERSTRARWRDPDKPVPRYGSPAEPSASFPSHPGHVRPAVKPTVVHRRIRLTNATVRGGSRAYMIMDVPIAARCEVWPSAGNPSRDGAPVPRSARPGSRGARRGARRGTPRTGHGRAVRRVVGEGGREGRHGRSIPDRYPAPGGREFTGAEAAHVRP